MYIPAVAWCMCAFLFHLDLIEATRRGRSSFFFYGNKKQKDCVHCNTVLCFPAWVWMRSWSFHTAHIGESRCLLAIREVHFLPIRFPNQRRLRPSTIFISFFSLFFCFPFWIPPTGTVSNVPVVRGTTERAIKRGRKIYPTTTKKNGVTNENLVMQLEQVERKKKLKKLKKLKFTRNEQMRF